MCIEINHIPLQNFDHNLYPGIEEWRIMTENVWNYIYCNASVSFTGVDECASSPCLNGGACIDGAGFYTCQCLAGWQGVNCEISEKIVILSVKI